MHSSKTVTVDKSMGAGEIESFTIFLDIVLEHSIFGEVNTIYLKDAWE